MMRAEQKEIRTSSINRASSDVVPLVDENYRRLASIFQAVPGIDAAANGSITEV